ncbi:MAG: crossover junction endodeoxyribonuclease RuvC [Myxococcota bacterium]
MRILGIDPGTVRTGWGIVDRDGNRLRGVAAGVFELGKSKPLPTRLLALELGLAGVIDEHRPVVMAIESVFYAKYANAAIKLGHARGVAMLVAARSELEVHEYPPAIVKRTVAGRGQSDKLQVGRLVGAILGWRELPSEDATDALAIAVTHAQAARAPRPAAKR